MTRHWILVCGSALLFAVACADSGTTTGSEDASAPAAAEAPMASTPAEQPAAASEQAAGEGATTERRLVSPIRGTAPIEFTAPQAKRDGNFIVTTFKVKNAADAPIAGFRVDEFWYDKEGNTVTGAPTFRHRSPLQPGEVIDVTLRVPSHPQMDRNSYQFGHANGDINPTRVPRL